ncbi:putative membrane protein [Rhizobium skierniewicense]|uniref:Putative membrane protein n=1 Tax=Rhizobium skierniewicense TaxID=984260 RepID=A0A7W6C8U8_9HYPH|nr:putative membrane protein [Rhizobium skierniewicense]
MWRTKIDCRCCDRADCPVALRHSTTALAVNQGLYNGFLAAGLIFGLMPGQGDRTIATFFLMWVFVPGLFGAATAHRKILFIQALPAGIVPTAVLALILLFGSSRMQTRDDVVIAFHYVDAIISTAKHQGALRQRRYLQDVVKIDGKFLVVVNRCHFNPHHKAPEESLFDALIKPGR